VSNNTVRTVVIFGIIALILGGAAVGGLRLMKARNASYASTQSQQTAVDTSKQQPAAQQPKNQAKKDESKSTSDDKNKSSSTQQTTASDNKQAQTPATTPSPASSTPQPATDTTKDNATANNSLPATSGVSPPDFLATFSLMLVAAFFGSKLLKARADYRRYLNL
jgi:cytoskeletal protein RodZ